eukprot:CAMPEP_0201546154 /NCGR_PEP_ID=MMETSP0173_2-20130828/2530_1 /ASSEMBLY_ACC=CAM_ASM_000268 /TAXON_ID=218659 /ORGANISM="Vexillifera sp., Strain DIVA3 564/2" /LENGTH=531 /DNA_ID=CAMNT_0047954757 /DNA_START=57 /DNA_END=1652 /DNA_ORIENTATION=+
MSATSSTTKSTDIPGIALDLGTRFIRIGFYDRQSDRAQIVMLEDGFRECPVFYGVSAGETLVGLSAYQNALRQPKSSVCDLLSFFDPTTADANKHNGNTQIELSDPRGPDGGKQHKVKASDCLKSVISALKNNVIDALSSQTDLSSTQLQKTLLPCVLCVSAAIASSSSAKETLTELINTCGFKVMDVLPSSVAVALATGIDRPLPTANGRIELVAVCELGVHTKVSVIERHTATGLFTLLGSQQNAERGGDQLDEKIVAHFCETFKRAEREDCSSNVRSMAKLSRSAEQVRRTLSQSSQAPVHIDSLFEGIDFSTNLNRGRVEMLCSNEIAQLLEPVQALLSSLKLEQTHIAHYVLVGGLAQMPAVQDTFGKYFSSASSCSASALPTQATEVALYGATAHAHALLSRGDKQPASSTTLISAAPHAIGVRTGDNHMDVVIPQHYPLPTSVLREFAVELDQPHAMLEIYEGEASTTDKNTLIGRMLLKDLPSAKTTKSIRVTFRLVESAELQILATIYVDGQPNKTQTLVID